MAKCDYCGSTIIFGGNAITTGVSATSNAEAAEVERNLFGIMRPPESSRPSAQLENILRMAMASNATRHQQAQPAAARA